MTYREPDKGATIAKLRARVAELEECVTWHRQALALRLFIGVTLGTVAVAVAFGLSGAPWWVLAFGAVVGSVMGTAEAVRLVRRSPPYVARRWSDDDKLRGAPRKPIARSVQPPPKAPRSPRAAPSPKTFARMVDRLSQRDIEEVDRILARSMLPLDTRARLLNAVRPREANQ